VHLGAGVEPQRAGDPRRGGHDPIFAGDLEVRPRYAVFAGEGGVPVVAVVLLADRVPLRADEPDWADAGVAATGGDDQPFGAEQAHGLLDAVAGDPVCLGEFAFGGDLGAGG